MVNSPEGPVGRRLAAVNINYDSLSELIGFPEGFQDPTRSAVLDRFSRIASERGIKYSIYVVGKDLADEGFAARLKELSRDGHEIGNHSWGHRMDLGSLSPVDIGREVGLAHDRISDSVGTAPVGFIAPAWNGSAELREELSARGYLYDTSSFPSWLLPPMVLRLRGAFGPGEKGRQLFNRRDWANSLVGPRGLHRVGGAGGGPGLMQFPLPTNSFRFAIWHTMAFLLPFEWHLSLMRQLLSAGEPFYYLCHPLDLLDPREVPAGLRSIPGLPRMDIPIGEKLRRFNRCLDVIAEDGREFTTVREIVESRAVPAGDK